MFGQLGRLSLHLLDERGGWVGWYHRGHARLDRHIAVLRGRGCCVMPRNTEGMRRIDPRVRPFETAGCSMLLI